MEQEAKPLQTQPPQVVQQPTPEQPKSNSLPKVSFILAGVVIVLFLLIGAYYLGMKNSNTSPAEQEHNVQNTTPTETVTPVISHVISPSVSPNGNLQTYNGSGYSVQYPKEWTGKNGYNFSGDYMMYDPASLQTRQGNGNSTVTFPSKFVDVLSITSTSETPSDYAKRMTNSNSAYNGSVQIRPLTVNNLSGVIYQESGEGSIGYDVILSNGKKLAVINVSAENPTSDAVVNQILSSFTFSQ